MKETLNDRPKWRRARRFLIGVVTAATVVAIFYTEEDWRGKRAWEECKRELEAKGEVFDWNAYVPAPVPDDENFFKAPMMTEWFLKPAGSKTNDLADKLKFSATFSLSMPMADLTPKKATDFLALSDSAKPELDMIREALKRPYARMDGDYQPWGSPVVSFISLRFVAQVFAQRARCYLALHEPQKALDELVPLRGVTKLVGGKPEMLAAGMFNVVITGVYLNVVAEGLMMGEWSEVQLAGLQEQLRVVDLPPLFTDAFKEELAATTLVIENLTTADLEKFGMVPRDDVRIKIGKPIYWLVKIGPRGWLYQNMVLTAEINYQVGKSFDLSNQTVSPHEVEKKTSIISTRLDGWSPFKTIADQVIPNFSKAAEVIARNQTFANEGQIVCALERFRLAHGGYPETLDALVPQFMEKIPNDMIGGQPLKYQRTSDGNFLLYSLGWNEKDEGGDVAHVKKGDVWEYGDWVWPMAGIY